MYFVYTDDFYASNSSVIDSAFYDSETEKLIVRLVSGPSAGYDGVSEGVWNNFKSQIALRGSLGSFWNTMIKPHFPGFSTSDVVDYLTPYELNDYSEDWPDDAVNRPSRKQPAAEDAIGPVEIVAADEADAPEIDATTGPTSIPGGFVVHPVEDVKAGADIGQRSYEITFEVVTVETKTAVVYAANDVEAENDFYRDFDEVKVVDVRRRF